MVFLFLIFEILAVAVLLCSKRMNRVFQLEKESHFLKAELLFLGLFALNRLLVCTQESSAIHMISLIYHRRLLPSFALNWNGLRKSVGISI